MSYLFLITNKKVWLYFLIVFGFFTACRVDAATISITDGTSTVAVNSLCSIREAIVNANDDAATNADCVSGSGIDTLNIQTDIVLTDVDHQEDGATVNFATPQVTESIIIDGNGFTISRSGANDMQFVLLTGGDISLSMNDVTISSFSLNTGFDRDGAVDLHDAGAGVLTLTNVTFDSNLGGAIHSGMGGGTGDWIIANSTFTNNVVGGGNGGIINSAPVRNFTLSNSTFTNNESTAGVDGAAITFLDGAGPGGPFTISISDSIFSGNTASSFGGVLGISSFFPTIILEISNSTFDGNIAGNGGGALSIEGGTFTDIDATITGSTFKDNESGGSGGAIYVQDGVDLVMSNNTFSGNSSLNGGGFAFNPQGVGDNSIQGSFNTFTGNTASSGSGTDIYQVDPTTKISVLENNIFNSGGDECGGTFTNYTFTNNLSNDSTCGASGAATNLDTVIADNGGRTETIALLRGSNAIDAAIAGTLGCPAEDQRGDSRPSGSGCDIGSFESEIQPNSGSRGSSLYGNRPKANRTPGAGIVNPQDGNSLGHKSCISFVSQMKRSSRMGEVLRLQTLLNSLGFSAGPVDGLFGLKTERGVRGFQEMHGVVVDGVVGPITRAILNGLCTE